MTTLTHTLLDGAGAARVGVVVTLSVYDGNHYAENARWKTTATSGAGGALSFTIPDTIHLNRRGTYFRLTGTGITNPPVVLIKPGTVSTTVAAASVGNSNTAGQLPIRSSADLDPVSQPELNLKLGRVYNSDGSVSATKRLSVKLTADGLGIDDLIVEDIS